MPVVATLTQRVIERAPFTQKNPYYLMEGGSRKSLRGFGVRVHRAEKQYVVRFRRKPYTIGRTDVVPLAVARQKARQLLLELMDGKHLASSPHSVADLAKQYMRRHARPHKSARSAQEDDRMWRLHVLPILGSRLAHDISAGEIQDLHVRMRDRPFAANRVLSLLSKAFNLAELWGWRERGSNPTRGIQRYPEPPRRRHLTTDEYRRLGAAIARARHERTLPEVSLAAVELLLFTGCRPGEVLGLRWEWVNLEAAQIRLPKAKGDRPGKRHRGRVIWLNKPALETLQVLPREPDSPFVLPGKLGQPLKGIKRTWDTLCQMAEIQGATPYSLRHSFVSEGVPAGVALELVSDLAGHRDIEVTDRVYRARRDDAQRAASETMGRHLREITSARADAGQPPPELSPSESATG